MVVRHCAVSGYWLVIGVVCGCNLQLRGLSWQSCFYLESWEWALKPSCLDIYLSKIMYLTPTPDGGQEILSNIGEVVLLSSVKSVAGHVQQAPVGKHGQRIGMK